MAVVVKKLAQHTSARLIMWTVKNRKWPLSRQMSTCFYSLSCSAHLTAPFKSRFEFFTLDIWLLTKLSCQWSQKVAEKTARALGKRDLTVQQNMWACSDLDTLQVKASALIHQQAQRVRKPVFRTFSCIIYVSVLGVLSAVKRRKNIPPFDKGLPHRISYIMETLPFTFCHPDTE